MTTNTLVEDCAQVLRQAQANAKGEVPRTQDGRALRSHVVVHPEHIEALRRRVATHSAKGRVLEDEAYDAVSDAQKNALGNGSAQAQTWTLTKDHLDALFGRLRRAGGGSNIASVINDDDKLTEAFIGQVTEAASERSRQRLNFLVTMILIGFTLFGGLAAWGGKEVVESVSSRVSNETVTDRLTALEERLTMKTEDAVTFIRVTALLAKFEADGGINKDDLALLVDYLSHLAKASDRTDTRWIASVYEEAVLQIAATGQSDPIDQFATMIDSQEAARIPLSSTTQRALALHYAHRALASHGDSAIEYPLERFEKYASRVESRYPEDILPLRALLSFQENGMVRNPGTTRVWRAAEGLNPEHAEPVVFCRWLVQHAAWERGANYATPELILVQDVTQALLDVYRDEFETLLRRQDVRDGLLERVAMDIEGNTELAQGIAEALHKAGSLLPEEIAFFEMMGILATDTPVINQ